MQTELRKIQQALELTFVYVTHDQEEALTMSDTVVVMNNGHIQQIGSPIDIYNEPVNAFVADFIGESNIVNGCMPQDCLVEFAGKRFECVDKGFGMNEMVDVVIRPEDVKVIPAEQAQLTGIVESVVFEGVHYEMTVDCVDHKWLHQGGASRQRYRHDRRPVRYTHHEEIEAARLLSRADGGERQ